MFECIVGVNAVFDIFREEKVSYSGAPWNLQQKRRSLYYHTDFHMHA